MTGTKKIVLSVLGILAAAFIISQLVMGMLLAAGRDLGTAHRHTGYTTVALVIVYIGLSLVWMLALPTRRREP